MSILPSVSLTAPLPWIALFALLAITSGCGTQGNVTPVAPAPSPVDIANGLLNRGDYAAAADAYLGLAAETGGSSAVRYEALAALALQDAGDFTQADTLLARIDESDGVPPALATAKACSMLASGFAEDAYAIASEVDSAPLSPYQRGRLARCLGGAAFATGHVEQAAAAWVASWRYPMAAAATDEAAADTWRAVSRLSPTQLAALTAEADRPGSGWYALGALTSRAMFDPQELAAGTAAWQQAHPGHPGARVIDALLERAETLSTRPRKLALLLPFDDTLGGAASAVRDGFVTAWYRDGAQGGRPEIAVYSTTDGDFAALAARAVAEGAEAIVGPLRKSLVDTLRADAAIETTVLALNTSDSGGPSRPGFFQFALNPEDEAAQVAARARAGGKRALLLAPDTAWGNRVMAAYREAWRGAGGEIVAEVPYRETTSAYIDAVKHSLNVDRSEARTAELRRTLNLPLHGEPRRRHDVDVILLAGFPANARQIMPQLRYFRAEAIPVFATSHVYGGGTTMQNDPDLDGITFGDMPWLFGLADRDSFNLVRRSFAERSEGYARLYGLGIDAYRLLPHLGRMSYQPGLRVPGVTGELWMDGNGVVHRALAWLRFVDGLPTLIDHAGAMPGARR